MYLTRINSKTGLVDIEDIESGVLAIKEFKAVIDHPALGITCFTAIALTADYKSPIQFYSEKDRPRKAMEEVTGNRDEWIWPQELIQVALKKYDDLQYDPVIEEGKIHDERKMNALKAFKYAEEHYDKDHDDGQGGKISTLAPSVIASQLRKINDDIKHWKDNVQGKDIFENSPSKDGYKLSRLEQKLEKKNSFYKTVR